MSRAKYNVKFYENISGYQAWEATVEAVSIDEAREIVNNGDIWDWDPDIVDTEITDSHGREVDSVRKIEDIKCRNTRRIA